MKYVGEFLDGQKNGNGTYYGADGEKYEGEWKCGLMDGKGKFRTRSR